MRRYPKHLEVIEYVGFNTGKPRPCRRRIVRFNGKRDVLVLYKPVVPFGKLRFQHIGILGADRVKIVVLRRDMDCPRRLFLLCALIDERKLHVYACVKVVEKIAPVFKNGGLIVCLCKLIVDVLKSNAL